MIKLEHIEKYFDTSKGKVHAVKDVSLNIKRNDSEPYCPKIMSGVPSKAAFNALTAFMPFFLAVPM